MGSMSLSFDEQRELETVTGSGAITASDIIGITYNKTFGSGRKKLWDFANGSLSSLTAADVHKIFERMTELDSINKAEAVAVVVGSKADVMILKLFQAVSRDAYKRELKIFITDSENSALKWLNEMVPPLASATKKATS